ncbi:hypothetical protein [Nocardia puris]|uniref:Uncharacterized protein n=1 Tax=Nocardia puris TaxID=208602 RepID=A0A366DD88_9NOCA|nr:hypothetical protein [Nocardia puris]RBO87905.1 hypothetical protein DFR74_110160 [Nocardia puris]
MTSPADDRAAAAIRRSRDQVVARGWNPDSATGATDAQIDRWAAEQGVETVPAAVREVLRLIGEDPGIWFSGTSFGVRMVDAATKRDALGCFDDAETVPLRAPADLLVIAEAGAYSYVVVDGGDLLRADPPLWLLHETGRAERRWESVTAWFALRAAGVIERGRKLAERRAEGRPDLARESHFHSD